MKNKKIKKIKWLRVLTVITFPLWIVPLLILSVFGFIILGIIETIQDLYGWCVESEPKPLLRYESIDDEYPDTHEYDYPDDDEYPSW